MKNFGENSHENEKSQLEQKIGLLEDSVERVTQILNLWEEKHAEEIEIKTILGGLRTSLETLHDDVFSRPEQPKNDQEWELFLSKMNRISTMYGKVESLSEELELVKEHKKQLEIEGDLVMAEANKL